MVRNEQNLLYLHKVKQNADDGVPLFCHLFVLSFTHK